MAVSSMRMNTMGALRHSSTMAASRGAAALLVVTAAFGISGISACEAGGGNVVPRSPEPPPVESVAAPIPSLTVDPAAARELIEAASRNTALDGSAGAAADGGDGNERTDGHDADGVGRVNGRDAGGTAPENGRALGYDGGHASLKLRKVDDPARAAAAI